MTENGIIISNSMPFLVFWRYWALFIFFNWSESPDSSPILARLRPDISSISIFLLSQMDSLPCFIYFAPVVHKFHHGRFESVLKSPSAYFIYFGSIVFILICQYDKSYYLHLVLVIYPVIIYIQPKLKSLLIRSLHI